ncbi:hypothetical protein BGZ73_007452 [Actinomortierella ambigua]|nr:hypothetical protein BGZ73_007452 [Actinomortierella ambigua]
MGSSKKKKSHRDDNDHHDPLDTSPAKPKLPTIKLSLRLPGHTPSSNGPSSTSSLSAPPSSASSFSAKKRRAPPQYDDSDGEEEDDDLDIGSPRSSGSSHHLHHNHHHSYHRYEDDPDPSFSSAHKKKKKHKHKHKHKHSKHKHLNHDRIEAPDGDEDDEDHDEDDETASGNHASTGKKPSAPAKLKIRLGSSHNQDGTTTTTSSGSKKHARGTPTSATFTNPVPFKKEHSRSRSRSHSTSQTPLVHVKQEEVPSSITPYQQEAHPVYGQKKPFATIAHQQQHQSHDDSGLDGGDGDEDEDDDDEEEEDVLAGDLDEPEEEEGDRATENDDEEDEDDDDDTLMSPTSDRSRAGSRPLGGSGVSTPTTTMAASSTTAAAGKTTHGASTSQTKSTQVKGEDGDAGATTTAAKPSRSGKRTKTSSRRHGTPKLQSPAPPKRKNIAQICHKLLDGLFRKDHYSLFSAPVDVQQVPDYALIIKHPMDLSTMRSKVDRGFYPKLDLFLEDFKLICDNCKVYNAPDTLYYKQAQKLWEWGSKIIEKERKAVQDIEEELAKLQIPVKEEETLDVDGLGDQLQQQHHHHQHVPHQHTYQHTFQLQPPQQQQQIQQQQQQPYQQQQQQPQSSYSRNPIMSFDEPLDSPTSMATDMNIRTPQQYRRSKRVKYKRDGTIQLSYSTDGSIDPSSHPDPWSLVPLGREYGAAPMVTPIYDFRNGGGAGAGSARGPIGSASSMISSTSSFQQQSSQSHHATMFQSYLDDYPYFRMPEVTYMPATYLDYGLYPMTAGLPGTSSSTSEAVNHQPLSSSAGTAGSTNNISAYTGMIFGDDTGEAYVRSLASFLEGIVDPKEMATLPEDEQQGLLEVKAMIVEKVARLTHGSSLIAEQVAQVLRKKKMMKQQQQHGGQPEGEKPGKEGESMEVDEVKQEKEEEDTEKKDQAFLLDLRPYAFGSTETTATTTKQQQQQEQQEPRDVEMKDASTTAVEEKPIKEEEAKTKLEETKEQADNATGLINVEQLIHDLELWPDFFTWKRSKIELDCLVPSAVPTKLSDKEKSVKKGDEAAADTTTTTTTMTTTTIDSTADHDTEKKPEVKDKADEKDVEKGKEKEEDLKVLWGLSWPAVSDPEEAEKKKKWVGEYLEQNAADMREVLRVLGEHQQRKAKKQQQQQQEATSSSATPSTAATPSSSTPASTTTLATYLKDLEDDEREVVEQAVTNMRRRLIKMAQYVPLSQVNPDKLPPPPPPPAAPAKAAPTSTSAVTASPAPSTAGSVPAPATAASTTASASSTPASSSLTSASATPASASASASPAGTPAKP